MDKTIGSFPYLDTATTFVGFDGIRTSITVHLPFLVNLHGLDRVNNLVTGTTKTRANHGVAHRLRPIRSGSVALTTAYATASSNSALAPFSPLKLSHPFRFAYLLNRSAPAAIHSPGSPDGVHCVVWNSQNSPPSGTTAVISCSIRNDVTCEIGLLTKRDA